MTPAATPAVVVLTERKASADAGRPLAATVAEALAAGATAILLREKDLPPVDRRRLAESLRTLTADAGAALLVAGDATLARAVGADGVHLAATDPWPDPPAPPRAQAGPSAGGDTAPPWSGNGASLPVGRSCHTVAELVAAAAAGARWATFSPVFATASKPGYGPALGLNGLAAGCRAVPGLAVLALGGLGPGRAVGCVRAGAAGVAVMGAVMRAGDPAAVVRSLVDELAPLRSRP